MNASAAVPAATPRTDASGVKVDTGMHGSKGDADILTLGGGAASAGFQELAKAYQALAVNNANRLTSSIQALGANRSPTEFFELQCKLMTEGVEAAVAGSTHIAKLTTAAFAAAFEPIQKEIAKMKIVRVYVGHPAPPNFVRGVSWTPLCSLRSDRRHARAGGGK